MPGIPGSKRCTMARSSSESPAPLRPEKRKLTAGIFKYEYCAQNVYRGLPADSHSRLNPHGSSRRHAHSPPRVTPIRRDRARRPKSAAPFSGPSTAPPRTPTDSDDTDRSSNQDRAKTPVHRDQTKPGAQTSGSRGQAASADKRLARAHTRATEGGRGRNEAEGQGSKRVGHVPLCCVREGEGEW